MFYYSSFPEILDFLKVSSFFSDSMKSLEGGILFKEKIDISEHVKSTSMVSLRREELLLKKMKDILEQSERLSDKVNSIRKQKAEISNNEESSVRTNRLMNLEVMFKNIANKKTELLDTLSKIEEYSKKNFELIYQGIQQDVATRLHNPRKNHMDHKSASKKIKRNSNKYEKRYHKMMSTIKIESIVKRVLAEERKTITNSKNCLRDDEYMMYKYYKDILDSNYRPDFALKNAGAKVVTNLTSTTFFGRKSMNSLIMSAAGLNAEAAAPESALSADNSMGNCWPMAGSKGDLTVQLLVPIIVDSISVDHISHDEAVDIRSAPKTFSVYGLNSAEGNKTHLVSGMYDVRAKSPIQSFQIPSGKISAFKFITFSVNSNYGRTDYTCIYRFRVHGIPSI